MGEHALCLTTLAKAAQVPVKRARAALLRPTDALHMLWIPVGAGDG